MQDAGPWPEVEGANPPHIRAQNPAARPETTARLRPLRGATK